MPINFSGETPKGCIKVLSYNTWNFGAQTEEYDALIALGAVIRGETYHFELVSNESGAGITRIGLDYEIPIANGVLTTENDEQCQERIEMKARDCARCAVEMANLAKEFVSADDFEENPED